MLLVDWKRERYVERGFFKLVLERDKIVIEQVLNRIESAIKAEILEIEVSVPRIRGDDPPRIVTAYPRKAKGKK